MSMSIMQEELLKKDAKILQLRRQVAALQIRKVYKHESLSIEALLEIFIQNVHNRHASVQRTLTTIEACCSILEAHFHGFVEYGIRGTLYSNANFDVVAQVDIMAIFFEHFMECINDYNLADKRAKKLSTV